MRILIADDDKDALDALEIILTSQGYEVLSAVNGREALDLLRRSAVDVIISDIMMPEMDGFELCQQMKIDPKLGKIPFIFHTATYDEKRNEQLAMELGASRFLLKPAEPQELAKAIECSMVESEKTFPRPAAETEEQLLLIDNDKHHDALARKLEKEADNLERERRQLRRSKGMYRRLVDNLQEYFVYSHGTDGVFTYISPSILGILGYSPQEFRTRYTEYLTDSPMNQEVARCTELAIQGKHQPPYELEIFHKDGSIRILEICELPVSNEKGEVVAVEGIAHDITERKVTQQELMLAKEEWERTFQAIGDIATVLDLNLRIIRVNQKGCDVFSVKTEELEGRLCYELFHGQNEPCEGCPVTSSINDFEVHTAEIEHKHLGKTFLVSASPVVNTEGHLVEIVHLAKDITGKKKFDKQLIQAQKMEAIGTLAGGITHDFNNILGPILGYADMALKTIPSDSPTFSYIEEVIKAATRATDLVKQILTFSRQAEQEVQPLKIQFVIKEALKLLRASIPTTIEIRQNIGSECGAVLADPTQAHQIIMNLCTNAYHAMREKGGVLGVALTSITFEPDDLLTKMDLKPGGYVRLEVSDTGCGMDKIVLESIFDPYYTTKAKGEGTGLGLSVVHGIVKKLHGDISVYSEPCKGTTFHVYFPVFEEETGKTAKAKVFQRLPTGNERVLLLDDEEVLVDMQQQMLESLGYQVTGFSSCEEALKAFRTSPDDFDLIITDMTMPKITGMQLAEEALAVRKDVPIILCTGFSTLVTEEKAKAIGIREFIMKPIIKSDLATAVRKVLDAS